MYALCQLGVYRSDLTYQMAAWQASATSSRLRGGGNFIYDPTIAKSQHNGGYIISPTVPITSLVASTPAFLAGTGETDPSGFWCLVRIWDEDLIYAEQFGAISDPTYDWNCKSIQAAINYAKASSTNIWPRKARIMDGDFRFSDPIVQTMPAGLTGRQPLLTTLSYPKALPPHAVLSAMSARSLTSQAQMAPLSNSVGAITPCQLRP